MYKPRQCGVKFDPPALVLYYVINATGKYIYFILYVWTVLTQFIFK